MMLRMDTSPPQALSQEYRMCHCASDACAVIVLGHTPGSQTLIVFCAHFLQHEVMVTNGANQAFVNIMLTLVDSTDKVVLFTPYYFNHLMALQMTGGADRVLLGPCHCDNQHPDLGWLQQQLTGPDPPRMVVIVNPCNPTGPRQCIAAGAVAPPL